MDKIQMVMYIVTIAVSAISFVLAIIASAKKIKNQAKAQGEDVTFIEAVGQATLDSSDRLHEILEVTVPNAIKMAEASGLTNGAAKKMVALSTISLECAKKQVDYVSNSDAIEAQLENLISLTNEVNVTKKMM